MKLNRVKLGDLIEPIQEINSELIYGEDDVMGMTITKEIIPTKADTYGADLRKYIIVKPNEFVYNPRTHGKKIGLGFNKTGKNILISWNNIGFKIKKDKLNIIEPYYLFINFNRKEWDREACFQSWGSSTEVFSWYALCDMQIELPDIEIQKKYVAIYKSMLENQKSYERGLEDLKISFEANLEKYKYIVENIPIKKVLKEVDKRNNNKLTDVQGINISKQFMTTIADTSNANLSNYKIVEKNNFAFSGMQTGRDKCIRIALNQKESSIIITSAYTVLEVFNKSVLPEYIMMWFMREEIDRLGWFLSDSSIRANLDLNNFFDILIPIPELKIQQNIVNIYNTYNLRKEINEKLKEQIKNICPILIKGAIEKAKK